MHHDTVIPYREKKQVFKSKLVDFQLDVCVASQKNLIYCLILVIIQATPVFDHIDSLKFIFKKLTHSVMNNRNYTKVLENGPCVVLVDIRRVSDFNFKLD